MDVSKMPSSCVAPRTTKSLKTPRKKTIQRANSDAIKGRTGLSAVRFAAPINQEGG